MGLALMFGLPLLAAFGIQWGVLALTRKGLRPLRWATLGAVLIPCALAAEADGEGSAPLVGLSGLAVFVWACIGSCTLLGWGLAWGAEFLWRKKRGGPP